MTVVSTQNVVHDTLGEYTDTTPMANKPSERCEKSRCRTSDSLGMDPERTASHCLALELQGSWVPDAAVTCSLFSLPASYKHKLSHTYSRSPPVEPTGAVPGVCAPLSNLVVFIARPFARGFRCFGPCRSLKNHWRAVIGGTCCILSAERFFMRPDECHSIIAKPNPHRW